MFLQIFVNGKLKNYSYIKTKELLPEMYSTKDTLQRKLTLYKNTKLTFIIAFHFHNCPSKESSSD